MSPEEQEKWHLQRVMRATLRDEYHREWQRKHRQRAVLTFGFGVLVLAGLLSWSCATAVHRAPVAVDESPPEIWASDGAPDAGFARPLPNKPFKGQKTPPCTKVVQVELNGGCWVALEVRPAQVPGCGADYFEHEGKCYLPVKQAERIPSSVAP